MSTRQAQTALARGIARPTLVVLAGSGVALAGSLTLRVVLARTLEPADVGALFLAIAVVSGVGGVASLGLALASGRRVAQLVIQAQGDSARRSSRTTLLIASLTGVVGMAAVAAVSPLLATAFATGLTGLLPPLAPVVLGIALGQAMVGVSRGFGDAIGRAAVRDASGAVLRVIGVVTASLLGGGMVAIAVGYAAGALAGELLFVAYCAVRGWLSAVAEGGLDRELWRQLPPFAAAEVISQFSSWMDVLVLGAVAPAAVVGYYGIAKGVTRALSMGFLAASHSFLPSATAFWTSGDRAGLLRLYGRARSLVLALVWPVLALAIFAPRVVIGPLFSAAYLPGTEALRWLSMAVLVATLTGFKDHVLVARGEARTVTAVAFVSTAAGFAALLIMAPRYGAVGAALAVLVQTLVKASALTVLAFRRVGIHPVRHDLPAPVVAALVTGALAGLAPTVRSGGPLSAFLLCGGVAVAGAVGVLLWLYRNSDRGRRAPIAME